MYWKNLLLINNLKEALFSLKTNKITGYDDINSNLVNKWFGGSNELLKHLFNFSPENEIFPEKKKKLVKVTPLFKNGDTENITDYQPTSALHYFFKFLKRIININIYAKKNCYIQRSLDSKKVMLHNMLLFNLLIKHTEYL